jgi:inorganic pyrophosphatase
MMQTDRDFWDFVDQLVATSHLVIDRPRGSRHPRYPEMIYPFDYGYLEGTTAADGAGIDVWQGSLNESRVTGIICSVDLKKRDAEIKILLGCSQNDVQYILELMNSESMRAWYIPRPGSSNR